MRSLIGLVVLFGLFWLGTTQVPKWFKGATADVTARLRRRRRLGGRRRPRRRSSPAAPRRPPPSTVSSPTGTACRRTRSRTSSPSRATPQREFGGDWQVVWDSGAFYLRAHVTDPDLRSVNVATPGAYFNGDGFSFEFGPDARALDPTATTRRGQDVHVMVGLSRDAPSSGVASINPAGRGTFTTGDAPPRDHRRAAPTPRPATTSRSACRGRRCSCRRRRPVARSSR